MATSPTPQINPWQFKRAIQASGLTIYDTVEVGDSQLWVPSTELEALLDQELHGKSLAGLALRTRSKVVKQYVCLAMGYPVPNSFAKTQPRFVGQDFDTYVQKANNLQIWNEELSPSRRYVIIRVNAEDVIVKVKVVTGDMLAVLDTTGTLTQKYQARIDVGEAAHELVCVNDTALLEPFVSENMDICKADSPTEYPKAGAILPLVEVFECLKLLLGRSFTDIGIVQERNRGSELHRMVCETLGYDGYQDDGRFPDIRHQLIEVKLQTSPTIDLGLVCPDSTEHLDTPQLGGQIVRHCDVRYAVFYAQTDGRKVILTHLVLTTGEAFFTRFPQFQGRVLNKKLQIPLPSDFFDG